MKKQIDACYFLNERKICYGRKQSRGPGKVVKGMWSKGGGLKEG